MPADDAPAADAPLLYELVVHGAGWRFEQAPSADADDGWLSVRELPPAEDGAEGTPGAHIFF